jgi:hypothetical protein
MRQLSLPPVETPAWDGLHADPQAVVRAEFLEALA